MSELPAESAANPMFNELEELLSCAGIEPTLATLAEHFLAADRFHEYFDVRLMQVRQQLDLPVVLTTPLEGLPEAQRETLETEYLNVCREVGHKLLACGKIRDAWGYLRPLGENASVATELRKIVPDDSNTEDLIAICLSDGVAPAYGYSLVLSHYGTCNAITAFDSDMVRHSRAEQQAAAALLVRDIHANLLDNVRADIGRREGQEPASASLVELIANRPALFESGNYHVDTTHLSAVMRIARIVEDPAVIQLCWELSQYGKNLDQQYQFAGEESFADVYPSHALFYGAQLGKQVDEAIAYFQKRGEELDPNEVGTLPSETIVVLLARLGRFDEALAMHQQRLPVEVRTTGFAPTLLDLCRQAKDFSTLRAVSKERGELLTFAVALLAQQQVERS